jgi:hypothetical protein
MGYTHSPQIVLDGLVLSLDGANPKSYPGSGPTWNDLSGNGNGGTLVNGPTFSDDNKGSLIFDGVDDYIIIPFSNNLSEYTIQFFCKWISSVGFSERIFGSDAFGTYTIFNPFNIGFHYNPLGNTPPSVTLPSNVDVGFNNWCQVSVTVSTSSSLVTIYVNGIARNSWGVLPSGNITGNLFIGAQNTSLRTNSQVGNFHLYGKSLNSQEILQNYDAIKGRYGL